MRDFREIEVWKKAHIMTLNAYRITKRFPKEEMYGETSQIRRCAASVPTNIAEGCGAETDLDFARFLTMAMRSALEFEYHILLANDLDMLTEAEHALAERQVIEVKKMLASFIRTLRPRDKKLTAER